MSAFFQTTLGTHLQFGQNLVIKAQAEEDATWFSISLTTRKLQNDSLTDVGLHMLVSLTEGLILFKQCLQNNWENLKLIEFDTAQFFKVFTVTIVFDEQNYHIVVNEKPCIYVKYNIALEVLQTLKIDGHLKSIKQVDHRQHYPFVWPPIQLAESFLEFSNEQPVPFTAGQFRNVWELIREELHMSVRFEAKKIIYNSKLPKMNSEDLEYGREESNNKFPFNVFHETFKLAVAFTESCFKIAHNGELICEYAYRTPNVLADLMGVKILGTGGVNVRVFSIDHILLNDEQCLDFANYSKIKYN